ncbi:MAG TPA: transglutaminase-like domain-containing protein [Candidatus Polarisedimenticolia bacterium]|nr:transglutaminase-like domain-containing protein [Candidatus Polarisedimenticolia bacterium]
MNLVTRLLVIAGAVLLGILLLWVAQSEIVLVTAEENGEFATSRYVLAEEDFRHPRLVLLRERERLDAVLAGAPRQFEAAVRLRAWAHRQWDPGTSFHYPPWDAVEILDLARRHDNRGFCAQYAIVFLQACQAMGIHARYVDLPGHFVVAIWSDDFDRWVLMDPMHDLHYEKEGAPLRGRDLHRAYAAGDVAGLEQVDSAGRRQTVTLDDLAAFRLYSIDTVANQLSQPVQVRINGAWRTLRHAKDHRVYPRVGRDQLEIESEFLAWRSGENAERFPERPESRDSDDFRYAMNQTIVLLANARVTQRILKVALVHQNSPTFARFQVRSEAGPDWVPSPAETLKWLLHPGRNEIQARVETRDGWKGPASALRLYYKPALLPFLPQPGYVVRVMARRAG